MVNRKPWYQRTPKIYNIKARFIENTSYPIIPKFPLSLLYLRKSPEVGSVIHPQMQQTEMHPLCMSQRDGHELYLIGGIELFSQKAFWKVVPHWRDS